MITTCSTVCVINPAHQIVSATGDAEWISTGQDPQFHVVLENPLPAGWWLLRWDLRKSNQDVVRIYPDYGQGFMESTAIEVDYGTAGLRKVCRFDKQVVALRIDPMERGGAFVASAPQLQPLEPSESVWLRLTEAEGLMSSRGESAIRESVHLITGQAIKGDHDGAHELITGLVDSCLSQDTSISYEEWIGACDPSNTLEDAKIRSCEQQRESGPLISILMPVYCPPVQWLRRAIDSVVSQSYQHWELCIADDASPGPEVKACLEEAARSDQRIRVVFRSENGHISHASNTALEMAAGEFVALLDHDDELHPHALHFIAEAIQSSAELGLVYSDEDKIDEHGKRFDPYFKPDWNPDLLLSQNYISHLGAYRTTLVKAVGGFRVGYEGSQDYDLALRCIELLSRGGILHIPRVLYHWRAIKGSTALAGTEKDYASVAAVAALNDHLARIGKRAVARQNPTGHYHTEFVVPQPAPKVTIIIPTRDRVSLLRRCIESILDKSTYPDYEILVVDNESSEAETLDYLESLQSDPRIAVVRWDEPFNYSRINNFAAGCATGQLLLLLNNDVEVISPDWLEQMAVHACREEIGAVGAKLYYPDGTIQHAGVILGVHGVAAHPYSGYPGNFPGQMNRANLVQNMSAVTAACLMVRRSVFEEVGGLDESFAVAFNDVDFCLRLTEAGYRNLWTPLAELYHHESATRGAEDSPEKQVRFLREIERMRERWAPMLDHDPAYNPNLTRKGDPFTIDSPAC